MRSTELIFEGSEKKLEISFHQQLDLLNVEESIWESIVSKANATILSKCENETMKAYLLSESSLFVWKNKLLLITCGQTSLICAVEEITRQLGQENISLLIYQRKNEYFSHLQPTSFFEDVKVLSGKFDGEAFRFGEMDEHHHFIFHTTSNYTPDVNDKTNELLLYGLSKDVSKTLTDSNLSALEIREYLNLDIILEDFIIDDFKFEPYGYSVNAIKEDKYFTIHITPQEDSSYISFETNIDLENHMEELISKLKPSSYDFITFTPLGSNDDLKAKQVELKGPIEFRKNVFKNLNCGYQMSVDSIYVNSKKNNQPRIINMEN